MHRIRKIGLHIDFVSGGRKLERETLWNVREKKKNCSGN